MSFPFHKTGLFAVTILPPSFSMFILVRGKTMGCAFLKVSLRKRVETFGWIEHMNLFTLSHNGKDMNRQDHREREQRKLQACNVSTSVDVKST